MTKSSQIMALYDGVRTDREIANLVGCVLSYVRVVARQRKGSSMSEHDKRYRKSPLGRLTLARRKARYASNPEYRADIKRYSREWVSRNPERTRASRLRYSLARKQRLEAARAH